MIFCWSAHEWQAPMIVGEIYPIVGDIYSSRVVGEIYPIVGACDLAE
jgi:hypothetical protein